MKVSEFSLMGLLLLFCISASACSESGTTSPIIDQDNRASEDCYNAPGVVVIAFKKELSDTAIRDFASSLDLEIQGNIYVGLTGKWVTVGVDEGAEDEWIGVLKTYENVVTAERDQICPVDQ